MHAARKNCTKNDPKIDARSPESTGERAKDRTEACNIEELDEKYLPRRQGDVIHSILQSDRGGGLSCTSKHSVYNCSINNVAHNECCERTKKCNHRLSLLSLALKYTKFHWDIQGSPLSSFHCNLKRSSPK